MMCTPTSFVYINFACVVHPIISGARVYLAEPALTLKIGVTLVSRPSSTSLLKPFFLNYCTSQIRAAATHCHTIRV